MGMINISDKFRTLRTATAQAVLRAHPETIAIAQSGATPKGEVFPIARIAGIQAAKLTSQLIPYCHPVHITWVDVKFEANEDTLTITATVNAIDRTGVEMEALTAATIAALTVYDILKPIDQSLEVGAVKLIEKRGGKSDFIEPLERLVRTAVLVLSDSAYRGEREDTAGRAIIAKLSEYPVEVMEYKILPDDQEQLIHELLRLCDDERADLIFTTGGTGVGPRDITPEATGKVIEREVEGIVQMIRAFGEERTPLAALSRAKAGIRGTSLIINLPGSTRAVCESLDALLPWIFHIFPILRGQSSPHHT